MPLETLPIDVPLGGGLHQDLEEHLVPQGGWLKLKNLRRNRQQGFSKRFGTVALPRAIFGGGTLSSCQALGSIDDVLLAVDNNQHLYEFSTALQQWIDRSQRSDSTQTFPLYPVSLDHRGLYGVPGRITTFDWCVSPDGLVHVAMETSKGGVPEVTELVFDGQNGALVKGPTLISTEAVAPRIFALAGNTVVVVFADHAVAGKIKAAQKTSTGSYGAFTDLASDLYTVNTYRAWDAQPLPSSFFLAYETNAHLIQYKTFTVGPITAQYNGTSSYVGFSDFKAISVGPAPQESKVWVAFSRTAAGNPLVKFTLVALVPGLGEDFAPATAINPAINVSDVGDPTRITIARASPTRAYIAVGSSEGLPLRPCMFTAVCTNVGGLVGPSTVNNNFWPASRPFIAPDGRVYIWVRDITYLGSLANGPQSNPMAGSLYLVDTQALDTIGALQSVGRIVAQGPMRSLEVSVNDFICSRVVTSPITIGDSVFCPAPMLRQLQTVQHPIERVWATWNDPKHLRFVQFGNTTYIQPGEVFDRNRASELSFHTVPPAPITLDNGGGGVLSAGTYQYCIVKRYINSAGEVVRSCPSAASPLVLAASHQAGINGFLDAFTDMQSTDSALGVEQLEHVKLEVYRTEANGDTFYLLTEMALPTSGTNGVFWFFNDNIADADIISKPILYTGQQAANLAPPSLKCLTVWDRNLVGIGPDGHTIWVSNQPQPGELATWNNDFNVYVPYDELTALCVLDDKLIAFSAGTAYLITGTVADALGQGNTLDVQWFSADMGCIDERGFVKVGEGIIFRDQRAFSILTRNLTMEPLGLPVQDEVKDFPVVKGAVHTEIDHEACFPVTSTEGAATGEVLRYNSTVGQWITSEYLNPNTVPPTKSAAVVATTFLNGVWYLAFGDGTVLREDRTLFTDSGTYVEDELLTPWIRVGSIAGFQRTRRVLLQAERLSPHDIYLEICQDFSEDVLPGMSETWTSGWLSDLPEAPIEKLPKHVPYQKGSAIRIRVKSKSPTDEPIGTGEGCRFFGLTLLTGIKFGIGKAVGPRNKR